SFFSAMAMSSLGWMLSDGDRAGLAGTDADHFLDVEDEYLAVADLFRFGGLLDGVDAGVDEVVGDDDLDLHLGQEIDDVFGAAIEFGVALLAAEALGLCDGDSLHSDGLERFLHLVQLERLDDGFDLFHGVLLGHRSYTRFHPRGRP